MFFRSLEWMEVHRQKNENIENRGKKEKELNFTRQITFCAMLSLSCELITSIVVLCQNYRQFMIRNFIIFTAQRNFALVSDFVQQLPVQETLSTHPVKVLKIIIFWMRFCRFAVMRVNLRRPVNRSKRFNHQEMSFIAIEFNQIALNENSKSNKCSSKMLHSIWWLSKCNNNTNGGSER